MNKRQAVRYVTFFLVLFCGLRLLWWLTPAVFETWELHAEDHLLRLSYQWQGHGSISPDIVHIDLDDKAVSSLAYSKADPRLYATLIDILNRADVNAILMDMVFTGFGDEAAYDLLVQRCTEFGRVYFPVVLGDNDASQSLGKTSVDVPDSAVWNIESPQYGLLPRGRLILSNDNKLNEAALGLGHINCQPDRDGVYRRLPLFFQTKDGLVPGLSLRVVSDYLKVTPERIRISPGKDMVLSGAVFPDGRNRDIHIPVDFQGRNRITFSGPWQDSFAHYSIQTVLDKGSTQEGLLELVDELEDTIVIVSDVSTGGRDFGPVPFSSYSPLSGLHAHLINSILNQDFIIENSFLPDLFLDVLLIFSLTFIALAFRGYRLALITFAVFFCMAGVIIYMFMEYHVQMNIVRPSIEIVLGLMLIMLRQFLQVQQEKHFIKARLTYYFAPSVLEKILNNPKRLDGVVKKDLTVLFSDIVGFTAWSSTKEADEIHRVLNQYFEEMSKIIFALEGTIDKYMGDGLLAFFGDPKFYPDHALRAVRAAIMMQIRTKELRAKWEKEGGMPIMIRIGIHSGEVVVGNMGSRERMDYTVIGSNVNLAQRLENNCSPGEVLISEQVYEQLNGEIDAGSAGIIQAKGFKDPVTVFKVACTTLEKTSS